MSEPEKQEVRVSFNVPPGYRESARLDVYLTHRIQNATRAKVQAGIREGRVSVNGRVVRKVSRPVDAGDSIMCKLMKSPPIEVRPENIPLNIVYEDDALLVVDKPPGLVVHPAYGNRTGTLVNALLYHVGAPGAVIDPDKESPLHAEMGLSVANSGPRFGGDPSVRPGIVHRLDKDTSGLLVVAKHDRAHARLARQFADRTIHRRYVAIVWGAPVPTDGTIMTWIGRDPRDRRRMATVEPSAGKRAVTHYKTLENLAYSALVEFRLETGRTHQIRIHALHAGFPVFGDRTYGGDRIRFGPLSASRKAFIRNLFERLPRQALHARELGFVHPVTQEVLQFESPIPEDMDHVLERLQTIDQY